MNQIFKFRHVAFLQGRHYNKKGGIFSSLIDNIRKEYESDKHMKENVEKFKKSTKDLEQSQEFQKIRDMYKKMEKEIPPDTAEKFMNSYRSLLDKVQKETDHLKKVEIFQKGMENVNKMAEMLPKDFKDNEVFKQASRMADVLEKEIRSERSKIYDAPEKLRTRNEVAGREKEYQKRVIEANTEATGVQMHKDSRWMSAWSDFKDNNHYMQRLFTMKSQFDESDSLPVRSVRWVTDKIGSKLSNLGGQNEMATVFQEISKIDSSFSTDDFLRFCQFRVIPNVLEAVVRGDETILQDWCHEAVFNVLSAPIREAHKLGHKLQSRVLDVHHVELLMARMMEHGPVVVIGFESKQLNVVRSAQGAVVSGDPDRVVRVQHHWALCRDQTELDPWAAWRIIDVDMSPQEQWF